MGADSYLHQNVLCILVQPARVEGVIHTDGLEKLLLILAMERGLANEHLIQEDTKGPPVNRGVVLLPQQYLPRKRSHKGRSKMSDMSFSTSGGCNSCFYQRCFSLPAAGARNLPVGQGMWLLEQRGTATPGCQNSPWHYRQQAACNSYVT